MVLGGRVGLNVLYGGEFERPKQLVLAQGVNVNTARICKSGHIPMTFLETNLFCRSAESNFILEFERCLFPNAQAFFVKDNYGSFITYSLPARESESHIDLNLSNLLATESKFVHLHPLFAADEVPNLDLLAVTKEETSGADEFDDCVFTLRKGLIDELNHMLVFENLHVL